MLSSPRDVDIGNEQQQPMPPPGTVHLVDLEHTLDARHAGDLKDVVLVPAPSDDPDDPLNWTPARKRLALACVLVYTAANGFSLSLVYSISTPLSEALGVAVADINAGTGYMFLLCGWGLLFWQPFALQYGKRATYVATMAALAALTAWGPDARGRAAWIAKNVVSGFFAAPIEALPETSVADLFFAHERGTYMAWYAFVLVGSNFLAPVVCGFVNDAAGHRWVFYMAAIFCAAAFVFILLFLEETNYDRRAAGLSVAATAATTTPLTSDTASAAAAVYDNRLGSNGEKKTPPVDANQAGAAASRGRLVPDSTNGRSGEGNSRPEGPTSKSTKTWAQKLSLVDKPRPFMMHWRAWQALRLLTWPVVFYSGFSYGTYLIFFNILNATSSVILGGSPYNFRPAMVGLSYISCCIGVAVASLYTGALSDRFMLWRARRNGGISEPEHRLWLLALPTLLLPGALVLWGCGAAAGVHWSGLVAAAMPATAFANAAGAVLALTYLVDSYRDVAGDALASCILVRNTMSFAVGYGIDPWVEALGLRDAFVCVALVALAACAAFLPFAAGWGRRLRTAGAARYWEEVARRADMGLVH